jgi:hypothetical protein
MFLFSEMSPTAHHTSCWMGKCLEDTWTKYYEQEGVTEDTIKTTVIQNVNKDFSNSINEIKDNT